MSEFEFKLPKMGESVAEATVTGWMKSVGDKIEKDEILVNVATDKVDSEVPSEVAGVITQILFKEDEVVQVGETMAIIDLVNDELESQSKESATSVESEEFLNKEESNIQPPIFGLEKPVVSSSNQFFSPLVKKIAQKEGISQEQLKKIKGTGLDGRVTKSDVLSYLENHQHNLITAEAASNQMHSPEKEPSKKPQTTSQENHFPLIDQTKEEGVTISRIGKLVSDHMIKSINTSVHVQSFIEADVTKIVTWRNRVKDEFFAKNNEKITLTPIFMLAVAKALRKFPMMNISFTGEKILKKKAINLGMAVSLPDGNLIVPVIKNADFLSLRGMITAVNDLATRARNNQLKPGDVKDGTYTVTNIGIFGSIFGTPIINQPEVGILALGAINKVPAVIETKDGDFIGIRHKMFISHTFDHRVVNGALGGYFNKEVKDLLEDWDESTVV